MNASNSFRLETDLRLTISDEGQPESRTLEKRAAALKLNVNDLAESINLLQEDRHLLSLPVFNWRREVRKQEKNLPESSVLWCRSRCGFVNPKSGKISYAVAAVPW